MEYLVVLFLKDWVVLFCVEHVKLVDEPAPTSGQAGGRAGGRAGGQGLGGGGGAWGKPLLLIVFFMKNKKFILVFAH